MAQSTDLPYGKASCQKIDWRRDSWRLALEDIEGSEVLDELHVEKITRDDVLKYGTDPRRLLIASMVWGYGLIGYGPTRTAWMFTRGSALQSETRVDEVLNDIVCAARRCPNDAFTSLFLKGRPRIYGLGVAMGSKFIYFASAQHGGTQSLVYDINVWRALEELRGDRSLFIASPRKYVKSAEYEQYCNWAESVASKLGCEPADVEYTLFEFGRSGRCPDKIREFFDKSPALPPPS